MALPKLCSIEDCGKPVRARGWCCNHYALWERNGVPAYRAKRPLLFCVVDGCENRRQSKTGYCGKHQWRFQKYGDPLKLAPLRKRPTACSVESCPNPVKDVGRRLCNAHYLRLRKRGDPRAPRLSSKRGEPMRWLEAHLHHEGDECLMWPFARHTNGEAAIGDRRSRQAARLMCILAHGNPPTPVHQAAHNCGKGHLACVNPRHLRWATPKENTADQVLHGTRRMGGKHPFCKLSAIQVRAIRKLHNDFPPAEIAEMFGVHVWTITDILRGKTWAWLE